MNVAKHGQSDSGPGRLGGTSSDGAHLRPATRRLRDVLAERGPLTGPITDAGTRALRAERGEPVADEHGAA